MKKYIALAVLALAASITSAELTKAQSNPSYPPMRAVASLPATCTTSGPDAFVFKTTTGGSGVGAYRCSATNTWTYIGAGREPVTIMGVASGVNYPVTTPQGTPLLILGAGISTASASTITSTVQTVLSAPAVLNSIRCGSEAASALDWIQIHDTTGAVTVGTTVPKDSVPVPPTNAGGAIQLNYTLSNGLKIAATTTAAGPTTASQAIEWCTFTYRSLTNGQ